jgi:hypothetical protein
MRAWLLGCCWSLAACGGSGGLRIAAEVPAVGATAEIAQALSAALAAKPGARVVVALDAAGLEAARALPGAVGGASAPSTVIAIAGAGQATAVRNGETLFSDASAVVAVELALLACHSVPLPPRVPLGTRTWTAANSAAGGAPRLGPGDVGMAALRGEHAAVLTTTPATDAVHAIALVASMAGGRHAAVRDDVIAAAKRWPQIALTTVAADGSAADFARLVREHGETASALLLSTDDWSALAQLGAAQSKALIALDPATSAPHASSVVGTDPAVLLRQVADAVRAALPSGGELILVHGAERDRALRELLALPPRSP